MKLTALTDYIRVDMPVIFLLLAVLVSAVAVIYTKHAGRSEFVELQQLEHKRDQLNEEWGRLLLEESTWASHSRVEEQARLRLKMVVPTVDMTVMLQP